MKEEVKICLFQDKYREPNKSWSKEVQTDHRATKKIILKAYNINYPEDKSIISKT